MKINGFRSDSGDAALHTAKLKLTTRQRCIYAHKSQHAERILCAVVNPMIDCIFDAFRAGARCPLLMWNVATKFSIDLRLKFGSIGFYLERYM